MLSIINRLPDGSGILPLSKKSNWIAIGAFVVGLIAVLANIGTIKDSFFKKEEPKVVTQPAVEPLKNEVKQIVAVPVDKPEVKPEVKKMKTEKPVDGTIIFNNNGKMEKTVVGNGNKVDIH